MTALRARGKYSKNHLADTDNADLAHFRSEMPDIYNTFYRSCLKCDRSFKAGHKFVRLCPSCKQTMYKQKESYGHTYVRGKK